MISRESIRKMHPSCYLATKGAMIEPTYAAFRQWDLSLPLRDNAKRIRETNPIGAPSDGWLKYFGMVLSQRFDPQGFDRPLVELAQKGIGIDAWRPLLLWHMTRREGLVFDFFARWLFNQFVGDVHQLPSQSFRDYMQSYYDQHVADKNAWKEVTLTHAAAGLAKMAVDFGILRGRYVKEFGSYLLPEQSFLYILHGIAEQEPNASHIVQSPDWRLFLMRPDEVERELFRLHQYRKLEYHVAGSLAQIKLPCASAAEYARERMA